MTWQLAQLNIARAKAEMEDPLMADFSNNLDYINGIAEQSDGFVWRRKDDNGNATDIQAFDDPLLIVNMSVWESVDALKHFMFNTAHKHFMARKREWFEVPKEATYVLWWVPKGHQPTLEEAKARLKTLRQKGVSDKAFSFKRLFPVPELVE